MMAHPSGGLEEPQDEGGDTGDRGAVWADSGATDGGSRLDAGTDQLDDDPTEETPDAGAPADEDRLTPCTEVLWSRR
jgi:hypothetical protein